MVSPLTVAVNVEPLTVAVAPPGDDVTAYDVIALPPLLDGAHQLTDAELSAGVADTPVGAPGALPGVTAADGADAAPIPTLFVAVTVNV